MVMLQHCEALMITRVHTDYGAAMKKILPSADTTAVPRFPATAHRRATSVQGGALSSYVMV